MVPSAAGGSRASYARADQIVSVATRFNVPVSHERPRACVCLAECKQLFLASISGISTAVLIIAYENNLF